MTVDQYLAHRRLWEVTLWVAGISLGFIASFGVAWMDYAADPAVAGWEPLVWEATSHVATGALVPLLLWFDGRFPIGLDNWRSRLAVHAAFTIPFSLVHVTSMYWLRVGIYAVIGDNAGYHWPQWRLQYLYEYLKDFRTYILFLTAIYLYRFIIRRLRGEAEFVPEGREDAVSPSTVNRLLIRKLGREFLVRIADIDWIESAGNYVNLHVGVRVYPLRETMAGIVERLSSHGFQRVHRSVAINLERVAEIVPLESGDATVKMTSGATVPVSRRYRQRLRDNLARAAGGK
jgi:hypothetical protein